LSTLLEHARDRAYTPNGTRKHPAFYELPDKGVALDVVETTYYGGAEWINMFVAGISVSDMSVMWKTLYPENIDDLITMLEFALKTHFPDYERKSS
jgi:hypothetical protein